MTVLDKEKCRELTRLARFMTRWLKEHGRDEWIVVAEVERDRSGWIRRKASDAYWCGYLLVTDRATMRKRPRLLVQGHFVKGKENARKRLLSQCWKVLGAKSVEEVALRWVILGDDAVLGWFDGKGDAAVEKKDELPPYMGQSLVL